MYNTLAASDYGLLDETTFRPRPNYWAALLWRRLMGSTVLDAGAAPASGLHIYAHCHPERQGAVTLLAINTSRDAPRRIALPLPSERFTLGATRLQGGTVQLNGITLALTAGDRLPGITGIATAAGAVRLAPATMTFFAMTGAANPACR